MPRRCIEVPTSNGRHLRRGRKRISHSFRLLWLSLGSFLILCGLALGCKIAGYDPLTTLLLPPIGLCMGYFFWRLHDATNVVKSTELELEQHRHRLELLVDARTPELAERNRELNQQMEAHQQALEALEASERRFRFITENSGDVIWTLDIASGKCTYVSPSIFRLRGYHPEELITQSPETFLPVEAAARLRAAIDLSIANWKSGETSTPMQVIELEQAHKDGHTIHTEVVITLHADESGKPTSILGVTRDITKRKRDEESIRHLAYYDGLTQLPNRRLFLDRLKHTLARAARDNSRVALLFVDIDNFKPINDELGHEMGDWLLQSAARRMSECLRPYDTAARTGGDEFVILLPDLHSTDEALAVGERLRLSMQSPFVTPDSRRLQVSSSIGVAIYPDHARTGRDLLRVGDEAMYRAKKNGRNNVVMLAPQAPRSFTPIHTAKSASLVRLNWSPAYCSGDPHIDAEHRELFRLANALLEKAAQPDSNQAQTEEAYGLLISHIARHFHEEEDQMRAWHFPQLQEHAKLHRQLLRRAEELGQNVDRGTLPFGEFVEFIAVDVVAKHMLKYDREYFSAAAKAAPLYDEAAIQYRDEPSRPETTDN